MKTINSKDPLAHTANIKGELSELVTHLREDVSKVDVAGSSSIMQLCSMVRSIFQWLAGFMKMRG